MLLIVFKIILMHFDKKCINFNAISSYRYIAILNLSWIVYNYYFFRESEFKRIPKYLFIVLYTKINNKRKIFRTERYWVLMRLSQR